MFMAEAPNIDPWVATIILQAMSYICIQFFYTFITVFSKQYVKHHSVRHLVRHALRIRTKCYSHHVKFKAKKIFKHHTNTDNFLTLLQTKADCCIKRTTSFFTALTAVSDELPCSNNTCFDTDSFKICVNTGASCSMSGNITHFENLIPVEHQVAGISEKGLQAKG